MLLVHLILSITPDTHCLKISQLQEENVLNYYIMYEQSNSHFPTALQSDVVEESRVPAVCLQLCLLGK
jgi:hypothetical protein